MRLPTVDLQGRGFEAGKRQAFKEAAIIMGHEIGARPEQVYHYLNNEGQCDCAFDQEMGNDECDNFTRNRELYFRELYGITREEYNARMREKKVRQIRANLEENQRRAAERGQKFEDWARDQGIDPKWLP